MQSTISAMSQKDVNTLFTDSIGKMLIMLNEECFLTVHIYSGNLSRRQFSKMSLQKFAVLKFYSSWNLIIKDKVNKLKLLGNSLLLLTAFNT